MVRPESFGFRPRRSALQALEAIRETVNTGCNHVLDADIRDYFGSIDQVLLMQRVERRISDRRVLKLLRKWLRAGTMEEGRLTETVSGTPQGGDRIMVNRHGRNLRAGRAEAWTRQWFWDLGLHRLRGTVRYPKPCMLHEKTIVKPCAGNPHARFERRRVETGRQ